MSTSWDPEQYHRFSELRDRAYTELLARIPDISPSTIVDLGCATGRLTRILGEKWPQAQVRGLDSSPEMVAAREENLPENVQIEAGDISDFSATGVDVIFSNAALQWLPNHRELLVSWAQQLSSGGVIAFQVPGNFIAPSHTLMRVIAKMPQWKDALEGVLRDGDNTDSPGNYARLMLSHGVLPDAWESSYVHLLEGKNPILEWMRGTGLRPVLDALDPASAAEFEDQYSRMLSLSYPSINGTTLFPFRRVFCIGRKL